MINIFLAALAAGLTVTAYTHHHPNTMAFDVALFVLFTLSALTEGKQ